MKLKFWRRIFAKYSNTKFHGNPSSGSRIVQCGWTDGQRDMPELFCERASDCMKYSA